MDVKGGEGKGWLCRALLAPLLSFFCLRVCTYKKPPTVGSMLRCVEFIQPQYAVLTTVHTAHCAFR